MTGSVKALNIKKIIQDTMENLSGKKYKKFNTLNEVLVIWYYLYQLPKRAESFNMEINNPEAKNNMEIDATKIIITIGDHKMSYKHDMEYNFIITDKFSVDLVNKIINLK